MILKPPQPRPPMDLEDRITWAIFGALLIGWLCTLPALKADEPAARIAVIDAQITARKLARPDLPNDFDDGRNPRPSDDPDETGSAGRLPVTTSVDLLGAALRGFGKSGRFLWEPDEPVVIKDDDTVVTFQPGTQGRYRLTPQSGVVTFSPPLPRIETKLWGLRLSPLLTQIDLAADNSATAHTSSNGVPLPPRTFRIQWEPDERVRATHQKPLVTFYTATWCGPCRPQKAALIGREFPFEVREMEVQDLPFLHTENGKSWTVSSVPSFVWINEEGRCKFVNSVADLVELWKPPQ